MNSPPPQKNRKIAKSHVGPPVRSSVCPNGTTRLPLNGLSRNLICVIFDNLARKFKANENLKRITGYLHEGY